MAAPIPPAPLAWPWVVAVLFLGGLNLFLVIASTANIYDGSDPARRFGYVCGAVFVWPVIIAGVFAIGRRFRNLRSMAIIVACVLGLSVFSQIGQFARAGRSTSAVDRANDDKVLAEIKQQIAVLQRQAVESDDITEAAEIQGQMRRVLEEALPRMSADGRAEMSLTLKIINPLMADAEAYTRQAAAFFTSPDAAFASAQSIDDLDARITTVQELKTLNDALIVRFNSLEADATRLLDAEKLAARKKRALLAGFNSGLKSKLGPVRQIRALDTQVYEQFVLALNHLKTHWGRWHPHPEGYVAWDDTTLEASFTEILNQIQTLGEEQSAAQQQLLPKAQ